MMHQFLYSTPLLGCKFNNNSLNSTLIIAVVAEVTQPSLGVGYEIGRAVAMGKKILCLYRPQEGKSMYLIRLILQVVS